MAASSSEKPQDKLHRLKENGMFWGHTVTLHRVGSLQSFSTGVFVHCSGFGMSCIVLQSCTSLLSWIQQDSFEELLSRRQLDSFEARTNVGTHESRGQVTSGDIS